MANINAEELTGVPIVAPSGTVSGALPSRNGRKLYIPGCRHPQFLSLRPVLIGAVELHFQPNVVEYKGYFLVKPAAEVRVNFSREELLDYKYPLKAAGEIRNLVRQYQLRVLRISPASDMPSNI